MHESKYKINGHYWRVRIAELPGDRWGDCDHSSREIRIDHRLCDKPDDLQEDTLAHELIHARCPDLSEDTVSDLATLLTKIRRDQFLED